MADLVFWRNGDQGSVVKKAIETNFTNLNEQLAQVSKAYVFTFRKSDWSNGVIFISETAYSKQNPCVDLYLKDGDKYSVVYGGFVVKDRGVELRSDMPYEGKVVIR